MSRVLIACVGNVLRGDDGFGVAVAKKGAGTALLGTYSVASQERHEFRLAADGHTRDQSWKGRISWC